MNHEPLSPTNRRLLSGRDDFLEAIRRAIAQAADGQCREICLCDPDFADWPLGERAVVESLIRWAQPNRKFKMLANSYDEVVRRYPRFVQWRRQWSHLIECRSAEEIEPSDVPSLVLAPGVVTLRLLDRTHFRAIESTQYSDALEAREVFDAISQRSVDAFPATVLGL